MPGDRREGGIRKCMKTKGEENAVVSSDWESITGKVGLTRWNMEQGTTALYITKGLSIERRNSGLNCA